MTVNIGTSSRTLGMWMSAWRSNLMPLSMKKIGIRKPKPIASSLLVIGCAVLALDEEAHDHAGGEGTEQHVQAELLGQVDEQDHEQDRDPHRQLCRRVEVLAHAGR